METFSNLRGIGWRAGATRGAVRSACGKSGIDWIETDVLAGNPLFLFQELSEVAFLELQCLQDRADQVVAEIVVLHVNDCGPFTPRPPPDCV